MARLPFVVVGDGPNEPSGLGRIARDLVTILLHRLGDAVDLVHVGGPPLPIWSAWRHVPMSEADRRDDWGAGFVAELYQQTFGTRPGVIFYIWDPARIWPHLQTGLPVQHWGYLPVDASDLVGRLGGVAGEAVRRLDRVVAYGRWGGQVLRACGREGEIIPLPHPIETGTFAEPEASAHQSFVDLLGRYYRPSMKILGTVATNQPRKDWALVAQTLRILRDRGHQVFGWWHTDVLVKAWSLPGLVEDLGLQQAVMITGFTGAPWSDDDLATAYQCCSATIAPGLGEGFGYPIVESLAAGTPVVHVDHAGGRELVPSRAWRFPVRELRAEGIYGLRRPVARAEDVANALERVWDWQAAVGPATAAAYCRGSVAHLDGAALAGRWQTWFRQGIVD